MSLLVEDKISEWEVRLLEIFKLKYIDGNEQDIENKVKEIREIQVMSLNNVIGFLEGDESEMEE